MANPSHAGVSLELNRHIANLLDSLSALAALADLSLLGLERDALLQQALEALMQNQDMERTSVFLVDHEEMTLANAAGLDWGELLPIITGTGGGTVRHTATCRFRVGEGIMGAAAASGELQHCRSVAADPRFKSMGEGAAVADGSLLCVPISSEDEILGVLNVYYPVPGFFTLWHERLLLLFCRMLGRLLINQRLFAQMEQMVDRRTESLSQANDHLLEEIIKRRQAEEEVTEQHRFLQAVIDGCMEPIMVINRDHRVRWMNKAARSLSGGREQQFCHQISHHRDRPCDESECQCPLTLVLDRRGPVTVLHEHFDGHGQPRAVEVIATPFYEPDGSLAGIIESSRDVTERVLAENRLRRRQEELQYKAYHDPLTGLPNRNFFHIRLHKSLAEAQASKAEVAILFLDLDGFKQVNDSHGHMVGDQLLQLVARRLQESLRSHDTVSRFGGDEFVVLLENIDHGAADAKKVAEKICSVLSSPFRIDELRLSIGSSIGVSLFPADTQNAEEFLQNADSAMYRAKSVCKGGVCFFGDAAAAQKGSGDGGH